MRLMAEANRYFTTDLHMMNQLQYDWRLLEDRVTDMLQPVPRRPMKRSSSELHILLAHKGKRLEATIAIFLLVEKN